MKKTVILFLACLVMSVSAAPKSGEKMDERIVQKICTALPEWHFNSSGCCAQMKDRDIKAWKLVLDRDIDPRIRVSAGKYSKGYLIFILVPDAGVNPGQDFISIFDWETPETDMKQFTQYLGRGSGYYWYMKGDLAALLNIRRQFKLKDGDDMDKIAAGALNDVDFASYTIRVALEYFNGAGSKVIPLILASMKEWQSTEKTPPAQHIAALRATGSKEAVDLLIQYASGYDARLAHLAIGALVQPPYMAPDNFYLRAISIPEYTNTIIQIFYIRKKEKMMLPRLKKIMRAPRTIRQYVDAAANVHVLESKKKDRNLPEYNALRDIIYLSMRVGDTKESLQYISLSQSKGQSEDIDVQERARIEPALKILRNSEDKELVLAAGLLLATLESQEFTKDYLKRIHQDGMVIIRMLPRAFVIEHFNTLERSFERASEKRILSMIRKEYGG